MAEPHEQLLPQLRIILPITATEDDAADAASHMIRNALDIENFEILEVTLLQEGKIDTPMGPKSGRQFLVAFRELEAGEVVFVHPDFDDDIVGGYPPSDDVN